MEIPARALTDERYEVVERRRDAGEMGNHGVPTRRPQPVAVVTCEFSMWLAFKRDTRCDDTRNRSLIHEAKLC